MAELLGATLIFAEPTVEKQGPQQLDYSGERMPVGETRDEQPTEEDVAARAAPKRERGKPSPGHARRTKAEIAEDEAADKADAGETSQSNIEIVSQTGVTAEESNLVEDPPEVQAQDAADEAAETAATRAANGNKLTLDDVRDALGAYVKAFGMDAAQKDGPVLIAKVLGVEPDPAAPKKISDLGDDQVLLQRAIDGAREMLQKNPFSRIRVEQKAA